MKGIKLLLCLLGMVLAGCASAQAKNDLSVFNTASPRSILVVPAINISLNVDAPNYLLTTLTEPLAERGSMFFLSIRSSLSLSKKASTKRNRSTANRQKHWLSCLEQTLFSTSQSSAGT